MKIRIPNLNWWMISTFVLLIILVVSLTQRFEFTGKFLGTSGQDEVAQKTIDFINNNFVSPETSVTLVSIEKESGIYKLITDYRGTEIPVYVTEDGSYMFLDAYDLNMNLEQTEDTSTTEPEITCDDVEKTDEPVLEAFVVSYCPYGLQMQRILAKIADVFPDNIKVRYIGEISNGQISAMHGEEEAQENLRQICIREEQPDKFWTYIEEFLKEGNAEASLQTANIDKAKLSDCMTNSNKGLKYAQEDFTRMNQFGVTGSPTLIINGQQLSEYEFGGRTTDAVKSVLCCGFSSQPSECDQTMDQNQANTGFTPDYSGTGGSGSC